MAESSNAGCPAKAARRKELDEATDLPHAKRRDPRHPISTKSSSLG